jgi:hypothetical protein
VPAKRAASKFVVLRWSVRCSGSPCKIDNLHTSNRRGDAPPSSPSRRRPGPRPGHRSVAVLSSSVSARLFFGPPARIYDAMHRSRIIQAKPTADSHSTWPRPRTEPPIISGVNAARTRGHPHTRTRGRASSTARMHEYTGGPTPIELRMPLRTRPLTRPPTPTPAHLSEATGGQIQRGKSRRTHSGQSDRVRCSSALFFLLLVSLFLLVPPRSSSFLLAPAAHTLPPQYRRAAVLDNRADKMAWRK